MNTEEEAKAYEMALGRAKSLFGNSPIGSERAKICSIIFPELAESEDKRIIRLLRELGSLDAAKELYEEFNLSYTDVLYWLKKQKEQKPLTTEETELNSIAFLEQMGYTCIPPRKEQNPAEPRKRNKPKESWLSKAKYEIEHADELLIQRQEELREIRELKKQEQHPSSKFQSGDWVVYDGPLGHAILQVKNVVDGRYTFVDNESTLLVEDSDKFLRPLTPKDVEKKVEWSEEDKKNLKQCIEIVGGWEIDYDYANSHYSNWLKSLPERFNLQPKEERSEEDEATIGTLINYFEGDALDCSTDEMIRRIRALRPSWKPSEQEKGALRTAIHVLTEERNFPKAAAQLQNILDAFEGKESRKEWKPSEEQMDALKHLLEYVAPSEKYIVIIKNLYDDLRKLM